MIKTVKDLKVYNYSRETAMEIFRISRHFPAEEKYSLTDQVVRSSRSVSANIREGYAKRKYKNVFIQHLVHSLGSSEESREWLDYALDCDYIDTETHNRLDSKYDEISAMLHSLINKWN